jgi:thiamine biosynthesis lipoprotein
VLKSVAWPALGTTAAVWLTDPDMVHGARSILEEEIAALDQACSRFRPDSELSRLNQAGGHAIAASDLFLEAVEVSLRAALLTDGDVDPTVGAAMRAVGYDRDFQLLERTDVASTPSSAIPGWQSVSVDRATRTVIVPAGVELDLGATAKALAADRAARRISERVRGGLLVNLGGDISIAGMPPAGGWRVQIDDDHNADLDEAAETVSLSGGGLATSSTTVRQWVAGGRPKHHIIDPRSGDSAPVVWRTVSVAAGSCVDANTASTAAIVRGRRAPEWLDELGLPSRLVSAEGSVLRLAGWPAEVAV